MAPSLPSLPQPPTRLIAIKDGTTEQGSTGGLITSTPSQFCGRHTPLVRGGGGLLYLAAGSVQIFLPRQEGTIISPAACFLSLPPAVAAVPDHRLGSPPSLVLLCRNVPRVAGLKSQGWIGSRDYWARSPVTVQGVAALPWKGWLSVQLCRGGGCESLQGSLPACELPPAKMGTCTGPGPGHN